MTLGADVQSELQAAVDQLKLRAQIEQAGRSPDGIAAYVHGQIHGLTVREVLTQAHLWTWRHLDQQNRMDDRLFERNATFPLTPDADDTIVERFRTQLHDIRLRQEQRRLQMRYLEERLQQLNPDHDFGRLLRGEGVDAPPVAPPGRTH